MLGFGTYGEFALSELSAADSAGVTSAPGLNLQQDPFAARLVVIEVFPRFPDGIVRKIGLANRPYTTPPNDLTEVCIGTVATADSTGFYLHSTDASTDFTTDVQVGDLVLNSTDASEATVAAIIDSETLRCTGLSGGTENDWDASDAFVIRASNRSYREVLMQPFSVSADLFRSEEIGGQASFTRGAVKFQITERTFDRDLGELAWVGAACRVLLGDPVDGDPAYGDLTEVATGEIAGLTFDTAEATLNWRDPSVKLNEFTVQSERYKGWGRCLEMTANTEYARMDSTNRPIKGIHPTGSFTILVAAAQLNHSGSAQALFSSKLSAISDTNAGISCHTNTGNDNHRFRIGDGTNGVTVWQYASAPTPTIWQDNDFHVLHMTVDREQQIASVGMDGEITNTGDISSVGSLADGGTSDLELYLSNSGSVPADHHFAWVAVYPWALNQEELEGAVDLGVIEGDPYLETGWELNEGTGTSIANVGSANWSYGVDFGGTASDYGSIADSDDFNLPGSSDFAIRFSFSTKEAATSNIMTHWDGTEGWYFNLNQSGTYAGVRFVIDDGPNSVLLDSDTTSDALNIDSGEKHTVYAIGRFTGTGRQYELWIDGILADSDFSSAVGDVGATNPVRFAYYAVAMGGTVYDSAFWIGRTLTEEEMWGDSSTPWSKYVQQPIDAIPELKDGLIFSHRWNEGGTTATVEDWSGNGHDVSLNGTYNWIEEGGTIINQTWRSTYEGGDDLRGKYKPALIGSGEHCPAVMVDYATQTFQWDSNTVAIPTAIYVGGDQQTNAHASSPTTSRETFSQADLVTGGPYYIVDNERGLIRFGTTITKAVTVSVDQQQTWSTLSNVVQNICTQSGAGITFNSASFTEMEETLQAAYAVENADASLRAQSGYWAGTERTSVSQAITDLMKGVQGFWYFDAAGELTVGILRVPEDESADAVIDETRIRLASYRERAAAEPTYRNIIGYRKYWQTLDLNGMSANVQNTSIAAELQNEFRTISLPDNNTVKTAHPLARELKVDSLLMSRAAARAEALRTADLYRPPRRFVEFDAEKSLFQYALGSVVQLQASRHAPSCDFGVGAYIDSTDVWRYGEAGFDPTTDLTATTLEWWKGDTGYSSADPTNATWAGVEGAYEWAGSSPGGPTTTTIGGHEVIHLDGTDYMFMDSVTGRPTNRDITIYVVAQLGTSTASGDNWILTTQATGTLDSNSGFGIYTNSTLSDHWACYRRGQYIDTPPFYPSTTMNVWQIIRLRVRSGGSELPERDARLRVTDASQTYTEIDTFNTNLLWGDDHWALGARINNSDVYTATATDDVYVAEMLMLDTFAPSTADDDAVMEYLGDKYLLGASEAPVNVALPSTWGEAWTLIVRCQINSNPTQSAGSGAFDRPIFWRGEQIHTWIDEENRFKAKVFKGGDGTTYTTNRPVPTDRPITIAMSVYSGTDAALILIDGEEAGYIIETLVESPSTNYALEIGRLTSVGNSFWAGDYAPLQGYVFSIQLWRHGMLPGQIRYWMNRQLSIREQRNPLLDFYCPIVTSYTDELGNVIPLNTLAGYARDFSSYRWEPTTVSGWAIDESLLSPGKNYVLVGYDQTLSTDDVKLKFWG